MSDRTLQLAKLINAFSFNSTHEPTQQVAGTDNVTIMTRAPNNSEGLNGNLWFQSGLNRLWIKSGNQWIRVQQNEDMVQYDIIIGDSENNLHWDADRHRLDVLDANLHIPIAVVSLNGLVLNEGQDYTLDGGGHVTFDPSLMIEDSDRITVTGDREAGSTVTPGGGGGGGITPGSSAISVLFPRGGTGITVTGGSATFSGNSITSSVVGANSQVQVNGVNFINTIDYTISGNTITFTGFNARVGTGDLIIITGG